jgi:hydroxymethylglutaryl-CoA lyase
MQSVRNAYNFGSAMNDSRNVEIVEVSARDGIQNLSQVLSTKVKVEMIRRAAEAGLTRIEATSFVNPRRVPQMADAESVVEAVRGRWPHVQLSGLVLNARGAQRAVAIGLDEVTFVVLATEAFNLRNQGTSRAASMQQWAEVAATCQAAGIRTCFMVGAAFGCPFEGAVATSQVTDLVSQALASAPDEVALADTIGSAVPPEVSILFKQIAAMTDLPMRAHLHNTRNSGYANAFAAVASGVRSLDAPSRPRRQAISQPRTLPGCFPAPAPD